jgi:hypothetical protein
MKQVAVKAAEVEKPSGGFISFKSGRLSIGEQLMPGDKIECIVVDTLLHNKYFDVPYNANRPVPPACYAFAREEENLAPKEDVEDQQSQECFNCPQNEWGSAGGGSRGKACTNSRRIWLLPADVMNSPDKVIKTELLQCDLPPTSIKNYSNFVMDLTGSGLPPFAVVVEMSVKPHPTSLFQVHFKSLEQIKDEAILEALAKRNWAHEQEEFPVYPTKEEMEQQRSGGAPANPSSKF